VFLKQNATMPITSGKPETLLTHICASFGYDWRMVGDTYLVYSKSWGSDRAADIPDVQLDKWSADIKKAGCIPLETALDMAALRDRQLNTVRDFLYVTIFANRRNIYALRLFRTLSKPEREAALKPGVLSLLNVTDSRVTDALAALFSRTTDCRGALLRVDARNVHGYPAYQMTVVLPSGASRSGFFTLSPPYAPPSFD
jgi:hypothetical protein